MSILSRYGTIAAVLLGVIGCSAPSDEPLVVWSNVTDTAFFVERYNLVSDTPVHFRYIENLTQTLAQETIDADVVIGRWVNTPGVNDRMTPVSGHPAEGDQGTWGRQSRPASPSETVTSQFTETTPTWVPLSYNLPALVYATEYFRAERPFALTLSGLNEELRPTATNSGAPPVFAPTASPDGLYAVYRSLGFEPGVDDAGTPRWQRRDLQHAIDTVSAWLIESYGSPANERAYVEEFLYDPPVRRIEANRIGAVYQDSAALFSWSFLEDRRLDFRWLADNQSRIAVTDNVVYAGIPLDADSPRAGAAFLEWLTTPTVQIQLVEAKIAARIDTFGFLDGFSTIPEVNTAMTRSVYPQLTGRIPAAGVLKIPTTQPRYWNEAVDRIVAPFFVNPGDAADLEREVRRWYLQRGD